MVYYGKSFTHDDVYNMPTYLRRFYLSTLNKYIKREAQEVQKAQNKSESNTIHPPQSSTNPRLKR